MLIKSLSLKNVRSYQDTTIDFTRGSTLISGDIGSGKSTILLAIEFALFGLIKDNITPTSLLRRGEKSCEIILRLIIDKKNIEITRILKKTQNGIKQEAGFLTINGETKPLMPIELKSQIETLLGYPQTKKNLLFRYSVYTPQEMMKQILFEDEEARLDIIRKVFGIDKYKTIKDNITIVSRNLRIKIKINEETTKGIDELKTKLLQEETKLKEFNQELKKIEPLLQETNQKKETAEKEEQTTSKVIQDIQKQENEYKIKINEITSAKKDIQITIQKIEEIKNKIKELTTKKESIKLIENLEDENKIKKEIDEITTNYHNRLQDINLTKEKINNQEKIKTNLTKEISELQTKILTDSNLTTQLQELKDKTNLEEKFTNKLNEIESEIEFLQKEIATYTAKIKINQETITKITKIEHCPTCLQDVTSQHKHEITTKTNTENISIKEEINAKNKKLNELKIKQEALKNHLDEIKITKEKIKYLNEKKIILEDNTKNLKLKKTEQEKTNEQIQNNIEILKKLEEIKFEKELERKTQLQTKIILIQKNKEQQIELNNIITRINESKTQLEELQNKTITLQKIIEPENKITIDLVETSSNRKILEEKQSDIKQKINEITSQLSTILSKKSATQKDIEYTTKAIIEITNNIKKIEEITNETTKLKQHNIWLNTKFTELIDTIEKQVLLQIHDRFNSKFQKWFNILIEDEDITAKLNEDFTPIVTLQGHDADILSLSGGEKTSLALAYRLALNKVINELVSNIKTKNIIILDEPTDGFSSQQLDRLKEVLDNLKLEQVIIVSHESKIESYVENNIRLQKINHSTIIR
ncbi:SMC family ATPase [Candidatus Woesearchaeota archaeon]|nr:SMC family ATPase [Candidatus Woesearchaeota archaeon]